MHSIGSTAHLTAVQRHQLHAAQRDQAALAPSAGQSADEATGSDFASLFAGFGADADADASGGSESDDSAGLLGGLDSFAGLSPAALRGLYGAPHVTPTRSATSIEGLSALVGQMRPLLGQLNHLLTTARTPTPPSAAAGATQGAGPVGSAVSGANQIGTQPSLASSLVELMSVLKELTQAINAATARGSIVVGGATGATSGAAGGGTNGTPPLGAQPAGPAAPAAGAAAQPAQPTQPAQPAQPNGAPAPAAAPDVPAAGAALPNGTTAVPDAPTILVHGELPSNGEPSDHPVMPTLADGEGAGAVPPHPTEP